MSTQPWLAEHIVKQAYPGRQLDGSQNQIRVLHLDPENQNESICCTLQPVSLNKYQWTEYRLKAYYHPLWTPDNKPGMTDFHAPHESTYAVAADYKEAERQHGLQPRTCRSRARTWRTRDSNSSPLDYILDGPSNESNVPTYGPTSQGGNDSPNDHIVDNRPSEVATNVSGSTLLDVPTCGSVACQCYEALSYTWGDFATGHTIRLEGINYRIPDNLYAALKRLRRPGVTRRLWIDAICINQNDLTERAQQVRMMDRIYSRATEVIVWLGNTEFLDIERDRPIADDDLDAKYAQLARYNQAVGDIMSHTVPMWWDRAWIVQEVAKAHYMPQVQLGAVQVSWSDLIRSQLEKNRHVCASRSEKTTVWQALDGIAGMKSGGPASILDYFPFSSGLDCMDYRDKVYSLLGMMTSREAGQVEVDYSDAFTASAVFTQATYAAIVGSHTLRALGFIHHRHARPADMPSWVIDFSSKTSRELGNPNPEEYQGRVWCKHQPGVEALVSRSDTVLSVRGLLFDTVQSVVPLTGTADKPQPGFQPKKKPRKPIDLIKSVPSGEFTLDEQATSKIVASLQQLPCHDPYCLLNAGDICVSGCKAPIDWQALRDCAQQHLRRPAENTIVSSRQNCLFAAWTKCLSVRERSSVDFTDEREVLLGLNREEKATEFSFFTTTCGFLGVGLRATQPGDRLVLLYGSRLPAVLHELDNGEFTFRGLSLVNGVSYGELCDVVPDISLEQKTFRLR